MAVSPWALSTRCFNWWQCFWECLSRRVSSRACWRCIYFELIFWNQFRTHSIFCFPRFVFDWYTLQILTNMNAAANLLQQKFDRLEHFCERHGLPLLLQHRIKSYWQQKDDLSRGAVFPPSFKILNNYEISGPFSSSNWQASTRSKSCNACPSLCLFK